MAVNPVTNLVYVANSGSGNVTVINGATNATSTVAAGTTPFAVAVDAVSNKIYVANIGGVNVTVIDGATNAPTTIFTGINPGSIAVNAITNQIYVADQSSKDVVAIDGASNTVTGNVAIGGIVTALAVNPVTNRIYAPNLGINNFPGSNNVTVIDGATNTIVSVKSLIYASAVVVNPATNKVYFQAGNLGILDGATNAFTFVPFNDPFDGSIAVGFWELASALNPATNKIYVEVREIDSHGNHFSGLGVIDGATNSVTVVPQLLTGDPKGLAVDPVRNRIYISADDAVSKVDTVSVIDGTNNTSIATVKVGTNHNGEAIFTNDIAVNPVTNMIYVIAVGENSADSIAVIDGVTNKVTTNIPIALSGQPSPKAQSIAVNPVTNKVYVVSAPGTGGSKDALTVIDGATNNYSTLSLGAASHEISASQIAVNPNTNTIYVAKPGNPLAFPPTTPGSVAVVNGNTLAVTYLPINYPVHVAVDPSTNKVYTAVFGSTAMSGCFTNCPTIAVIDGATNATTTITLPVTLGVGFDGALRVNPITNKVYISGAGQLLDVFTEEQPVPNPLNTTVTPLPGNVTSNPSPTFDFTTTSTFAPIAPPVENVYYQLDTTQGQWLPATGLASSFTGQLSNVQLGSHILYFYATDGSDSTDLAIGATSIGAISAYPFTVVNP